MKLIIAAVMLVISTQAFAIEEQCSTRVVEAAEQLKRDSRPIMIANVAEIENAKTAAALGQAYDRTKSNELAKQYAELNLEYCQVFRSEYTPNDVCFMPRGLYDFNRVEAADVYDRCQDFAQMLGQINSGQNGRNIPRAYKHAPKN